MKPFTKEMIILYTVIGVFIVVLFARFPVGQKLLPFVGMGLLITLVMGLIGSMMKTKK